MAPDDRTVSGTIENAALGRGALYVLVCWGDAIARHVLPSSGQVLLGRGDDAEVPLADPLASRRQAILHLGDPLRLEDLGSKNGTRLRGRRLEPREVAEIHLGDFIQFGSAIVILM